MPNAPKRAARRVRVSAAELRPAPFDIGAALSALGPAEKPARAILERLAAARAGGLTAAAAERAIQRLAGVDADALSHAYMVAQDRHSFDWSRRPDAAVSYILTVARNWRRDADHGRPAPRYRGRGMSADDIAQLALDIDDGEQR